MAATIRVLRLGAKYFTFHFVFVLAFDGLVNGTLTWQVADWIRQVPWRNAFKLTAVFTMIFLIVLTLVHLTSSRRNPKVSPVVIAFLSCLLFDVLPIASLPFRHALELIVASHLLAWTVYLTLSSIKGFLERLFHLD